MSAVSSAVNLLSHVNATARASSPEHFPAMSRSGVRDLLRFVGAATITGVVASLLLMAAILFLVGSA
ncbi:MAG: hypothetical protein FWC42_00565 [Proteobacteria bacterium]|nr:hypothetical protein [Pseudomonadota bacterium]